MTEDACDPITIALLIDDALLADRVAAVLGNVAGVRLVGQSEPADVVLVSTGNASEGPSPDEGIAAVAADASPSEAVLTPREREVLALLAEGASNKAIARRLGISFHTAKFHVAGILAKLDADSRTEAVTKAAQLGLVML